MGLEKFGILKHYNNNVRTTKSYTLKQRYEDFIVKEINEDIICDEGSIIDLNMSKEGINYLINLLEKKDKSVCDVGADTENLQVSTVKEITFGPNIQVIDSNITYNNELLDLHDYETNNLVEIATIKNLSRQERTQIHQLIKQHPLTHAETINSDSISVFFGYKKIRYKFTLKKTNRDSMNSCQYIAKSLNVPFKSIKFAGNKDKRAITYQNVTVDCFFIDLYNLATRLQQEDSSIRIFNIKQCNKHLSLGELEGNRFIITIKPTKEDASLDLNYKNLENGFYNYYGQQRFGMAGNNHIVGKSLLEKNYSAAINTIMQPCDRDNKIIQDIKKLYFEGQFDNIDFKPEYKRSIEGKILYNKVNQKNDKLVFKQLPNELLKLYFHAYQSYAFNCLINETEAEYIVQSREMSKHLKGNKRLVVERAKDVVYEQHNNKAIVSFTLNPGVFATMALREMIGDDVYHTEEI